MSDLNESGARVYVELWISLVSLLRSYTAVHGLNGNRQASIVHDDRRILICHKSKWLALGRQGAIVKWARDDGSQGTLEIMETGRLRSNSSEEEMDMAAEAWARELMQ